MIRVLVGEGGGAVNMCFSREISCATSSLHGHNVTAPAAKMADPCSFSIFLMCAVLDYLMRLYS